MIGATHCIPYDEECTICNPSAACTHCGHGEDEHCGGRSSAWCCADLCRCLYFHGTPTVEIMADFALAMELQDTAVWIASNIVTTSLAPNQHIDRISRAIRFLHGERTAPDVSGQAIRRSLRNDPFVAAVYALAYADAATRLKPPSQ